MFVLIGVAVLLGIYYRVPGTSYPYEFGWGWIWLIFAFFWIVPWVFGRGWRGYRYRRWYRYDDGSYQILRERYAKGEITKEQFDQMMRDLQQHEQ